MNKLTDTQRIQLAMETAKQNDAIIKTITIEINEREMTFMSFIEFQKWMEQQAEKKEKLVKFNFNHKAIRPEMVETYTKGADNEN